MLRQQHAQYSILSDYPIPDGLLGLMRDVLGHSASSLQVVIPAQAGTQRLSFLAQAGVLCLVAADEVTGFRLAPE